jgi:hypothetical protein
MSLPFVLWDATTLFDVHVDYRLETIDWNQSLLKSLV